jgi:hypothetical protein
MGLLDALSDPVLLAKINEQIDDRKRLAVTLADRWGCSQQSALVWLDQEEAAAMELFAIGNTVPRNILN